MPFDSLRFHRLQAGLYSNPAGHRVERMTGDHIAAATPWRLIDPAGEWMGDHATLTAAQASIRDTPAAGPTVAEREARMVAGTETNAEAAARRDAERAELAQLQAEGREEIAADDAAGRAMLEAGRVPIETVTPGAVVRVNGETVTAARTVRARQLVRLHDAAGRVILAAEPGALVTVEAAPEPGPCPSVPQILRALELAGPLAVGYAADWLAVLVAAHASMPADTGQRIADDAGRILTRAGWLVAADYVTHPAALRVFEPARPGIRTAL